MYQLFDVYYLSRVLGETMTMEKCSNFWQALKEKGSYIPDGRGQMGVSWDDVKFGSLKNKCLSRLSIYNQVYGGYRNIPNTTYTMENLNTKIFPAIAKLVKPTHTMFGNQKAISVISYQIMDIIVTLLKTKRFFRSYTWIFWEAIRETEDMPKNNSSGLRPGIVRKKIVNGIVYSITVTGKKANQFKYCMLQIVKMYSDVKAGEIPKLKDKAWCEVPKNEILAGTTYDEIIKFFTKLRLFCIPTATLARLQRMIHFTRQKIERGHHIAIGSSFWHGGAERLAKRLHYNRPGYKWITGDFSGLDTTLKAHLLLIYSYFTSVYYKKDTPDYDVFVAFLKIVADNLTLKVVHCYSDIWKLIYGGMPSGAYETSHGDSWIVMFVFIHYFLFIGQRFPLKMGLIRKYLIEEIMMFFIYGDDHVIAIPPGLQDCVDGPSLITFCRDMYQM